MKARILAAAAAWSLARRGTGLGRFQRQDAGRQSGRAGGRDRRRCRFRSQPRQERRAELHRRNRIRLHAVVAKRAGVRIQPRSRFRDGYLFHPDHLGEPLPIHRAGGILARYRLFRRIRPGDAKGQSQRNHLRPGAAQGFLGPEQFGQSVRRKGSGRFRLGPAAIPLGLGDADRGLGTETGPPFRGRAGFPVLRPARSRSPGSRAGTPRTIARGRSSSASSSTSARARWNGTAGCCSA